MGAEMLLDFWENDPEFRDALRRDPETAVRERNIELSAEEWAALRAVDWTHSDQALSYRATRFGV